MSHYSRQNPFYAPILSSCQLNHSSSPKHTYHVVLDLSGSGIIYDVGDCVGILPHNDPEMVESTLAALHSDGTEIITSRHYPDPLSLKTLLLQHCSLASVTRSLVTLASEQHPALKPLLTQEERHTFKEFIAQREVWDFLAEFPLTPPIDSQAVSATLAPLLPRFYSIASHQATVDPELHLTVAYLRYTSQELPRLGTCTHYLCTLAPSQNLPVPLYLQPHKGFTLPDDPTAAIIMIGPGTGVAPYRGFMQKRLHRRDSGPSWLFFGERHADSDFLYADFWHSLEAQGKLRLSTAFSRDQEHKIYVQHCLWEQGKDVYQWIKDGAYIFVCGDAAHMAKDVEATLLRIFHHYGHMSGNEASAYLKELRQQKRYLRDVY